MKFEYESGTGDSYVAAVTPVVEELEQVRLVVVGPVQEGGFQEAHAATGGRVTALGERLDNELLYQAVDIYVDSYPQMSPTSLLEAGSYGTPLLALCPQLHVAPILSGDAPGIDDGLLRARSVEEFRAQLRALVLDPASRIELGARTSADIERLHVGDGWRAQLEALYRMALETSPLTDVPEIGDVPHHGPPDSIIALGSPPDVDADDLLIFHLRLLPAHAGFVRGSSCGGAASDRPWPS